MTVMRATIVALAAAAIATTEVGAQSVGTRSGFATRTVREENTSPHAFGAFVLGFAPGQLWFGGNREVRRIWPDGSWTTVHALPSTERIGLLTAPGDATAVFFTNFDANMLFRYDIGAGTLTSQPVLANTFDLAVAPTGEVVVSANPSFPAPGAATGIWIVDPTGAANHREIVRLTGPSGPIAYDPATGDLFVALIPATLPPPPGSVQLLRFAAAALQQVAAQPGATPLTTTDAVASLPLDGAFDMAFDAGGRLYVSDVNNRSIYRSEVGAWAFESSPFASGGTHDLTSLQFTAFGRGTFRAYQPTSGGTLFVGTAPTPSRAGLVAIEPARPELSTSLPGPVPIGPYDLRLRGLPRYTNAWLCLSARAPVTEIAVLPFDGRPLWFGLDLTAPVVSVPIALGAGGDATLALQNLGAGITVSLQVLGLDTAGAPVLASSNTFQLQLLP